MAELLLSGTQSRVEFMATTVMEAERGNMKARRMLPAISTVTSTMTRYTQLEEGEGEGESIVASASLSIIIIIIRQ